MIGHPTVAVTATHATREKARSTVRSALGAAQAVCIVVDVDGTYVPVGEERVIGLHDLAVRLEAVNETQVAAATLEPDELEFHVGVLAASLALAEGVSDVVVLAAGVILFDGLESLLAAASGNTAVLPRTDVSTLGHTGTPGTLVDHAMEFGPVKEPAAGSGSLFTRSLVVFGPEARLDVLRRLSSDWRFARNALDSFVATTGGAVVHTHSALLSPWRGGRDLPIAEAPDGRLLVETEPITALDLSKFDPEKPWILEPVQRPRPTTLLSEHPALVDVIGRIATDWQSDASVALETASEVRVPRDRFDWILRQEARRSTLIGGDLPDLLDGDVALSDEIVRWATATIPATHPRPVARYLAGVRASRDDLMEAFPRVPGPDSGKLGRWGVTWGLKARNIDLELVRLAGEATLAAQPAAPPKGRRPEGVNLVGYLSGELGLGESGRLVDAALHAAGVPSSTFDVSRRLASRQSATYRVSDQILYDTTLLCVNGGETPDVIKQLGNVTRGTRRIGMWYWELEEFHAGHANGFGYVDEVWAATDFMRDSIAAKSPGIPVRTVMPPLPQRDGDAGEFPARFGIDPARPYFLFTFDFLSLAGRKNPYGLVEAFEKAFPTPTPDGPQLVIKTINGDKQSSDAERLRLQMADRPDLILIEEYLPNDERHVLVAHCTAYVSLHKAEGLGLTLAEAMAWGKPVIATRYGGVVQFMNDENSFLLGWQPGVIPEDMGPYNKGLAWAEPNLDEASELMRLVFEQPDRAAAVGERAARDIRELHNVDVAGTHMREALAAGRAEMKAAQAAKRKALREERALTAPAPPPRSLARRASSRARAELRKMRARLRPTPR